MTGPPPRPPPLEGFFKRLRDAVAAVPSDATRPPPGARVGAVLVLVDDGPGGPGLLLTRRRADLRAHPGQIAFPGGRVDPGETAEEAALREAWEEVGVRPETVEVVGRGPTHYIPPSRFWVVPVVALWESPHPLEPNPREVDEVLRAPVAALLEPSRWRCVPSPQGDVVWAWDLDDGLLWGATAAMVTVLLDVVVGDWSSGVTPADLPAERLARPWRHSPPWRPRVRLPGAPQVPAAHLPRFAGADARRVEDLLAAIDPQRAEQVRGAVADALAGAVADLVGGDLDGAEVTVLAGGRRRLEVLAAARRLAAGGAGVAVRLVGEAPGGEGEALDAAGVDTAAFSAPHPPGDVIVDAIGAPAGASTPAHAAAVEWLRRHDVPVLAVDLPAGLDPDRGPVGLSAAADVTVAVMALKPAHTLDAVRPYLGDLYLAEVDIPPDVCRRAGVELPRSPRSGLVRVVG